MYLSPDATEALDVTQRPPSTVVVGLLIDRRTVQVNRSLNRANNLQLPTARWPLDLVSDVLDPQEPLNVDCVLEGMQQWYWNCEAATATAAEGDHSDTESLTGCFQQAAIQALRHHQERHPERPMHKQRPM